MTWEQVLAGALGSSPIAVAAIYALRVVWNRLLEREKRLDAILDALLAATREDTHA